MADWYKEITPNEKRTFWASFGGWSLDSFDVNMYSLALAALSASLGISNAQAGSIASVTLFFGAFGGWLGGALGDRYGRVKALQITVLTFSLATFACAFAQDYAQLMAFRALQGLGFGAEWACGAVLMSEVIRAEHRGKALGLVQAGWAVGWAAAVLVYSFLPDYFGKDLAWRVFFAIGILPALFILYIRRGIEEPPRKVKPEEANVSLVQQFGMIFKPEVLRGTLVGALFGTGAHGGYYALTTFLPKYLEQERGLSVKATGAYLAVIIFAFFIGCMTSGRLSDRIGRRKNVLFFAICCVATVLVYIFVPLSNTYRLLIGLPLGFFSAGIPASMAALFAEIYPAGMRGTGVGFCYNFGRIFSAAFPALIGALSASMGLGNAIGVFAASAYSLVIVAALLLPETRGKVFDDAGGLVSTKA